VVQNSASHEHGAARVIEHPVLGELATAPIVSFTFDGVRVEGRAGEPIAAALIAAGYRVFRTMPKRADARGGYCMVGRCSDCLVVVDGTPNVRACITPISEGMRVGTRRGLGEEDTVPDRVGEP
jgi:predicted molibdopterin-dependent oxidoreductase YjgC